MYATKARAIALSMLLAVGAVAPSNASTITVGFTGVLTSAVNNVYDDPDVPSSNFFQVGQAFSGSLVYDAGAPSFEDNSSAYFDLDQFNVDIGGVDFSTRFLPRELYRSSNGDVFFLSGGADQGGSTSIDLNLSSYYGNYPAAAELTGKTAEFSFADYYPLGGQVSGLARLDARSAASPVPEPETWLLMVLGFGAIGCLIRRVHYKSEERFTKRVRSLATA